MGDLGAIDEPFPDNIRQSLDVYLSLGLDAYG
jgi:hypothetical protein